MSKQANQLVGTSINNTIIPEAIPDLGHGFYAEDGRGRQRGRGREDGLIGFSGVSTNLASDPMTTFSQGLELPYEEDYSARKNPEVLFVSGQGHGGNKGPQEQEQPLTVLPTEENDVLVPTSSDSFAGQGKGDNKGKGQPFAITSSDKGGISASGSSGSRGRTDNDVPGSMGGPPAGRGSSGDHGGGEPDTTETAGNNLAYPVIWSEGVEKTLQGTFGVTELGTNWVYSWEGDDPNTSEIEEYITRPYDPDNPNFYDDAIYDLNNPNFYDDIRDDQFNPGNTPGTGWIKAYPQKDPANTWQAASGTPEDFGVAEENGTLIVDRIDWGDNLESVDWYMRSQVRTEVVLFKDLVTPALDYEMRYISGWGIDEVHGLGVEPNGEPILGEGMEATVYSNNARFTIQKLNFDIEANSDLLDELTWVAEEGWTEAADYNGGDSLINAALFNGAVYEGEDGPGSYSAEINVKGRIIYGYTWNVRQLNDGPGYYRLTFSFDELTGTSSELNTFFREGQTTILVPEEETEVVTLAEESDDGGSSPDGGGVAKIDFANNLTYIDINILERSGGGNRPQSDSLSETIPDFGAIASEMTGFSTSTESSII